MAVRNLVMWDTSRNYFTLKYVLDQTWRVMHGQNVCLHLYSLVPFATCRLILTLTCACKRIKGGKRDAAIKTNPQRVNEEWARCRLECKSPLSHPLTKLLKHCFQVFFKIVFVLEMRLINRQLIFPTLLFSISHPFRIYVVLKKYGSYIDLASSLKVESYHLIFLFSCN